MPLVWAHAEYLKLQRSLRDGRVYDMPPQTWQRYVIDQAIARYASWRFNHKLRVIEEGRQLRLETLVSTLVHWSTDEWRTTHDTPARDTGLGEYVVDLPTETLPPGSRIDFTFYWPEVDRWEGTDFQVVVDLPVGSATAPAPGRTG
jgi:glucoamylase